MGRYTQLYVHHVWATRDRLPLIGSEIEERLYAAVTEKYRKLGCLWVVINGMSDHVHLLVEFPTTRTVCGLIKEVKGMSSHFANTIVSTGDHFQWQKGYGTFSLGGKAVTIVEAYVRNRKRHHVDGTLIHKLEQCDGVDDETSADD